MQTNRSRSLVVLTSVSIQAAEPGRYRLPRKFADGMQAYADAWDGPVYALCDPDSKDGGNLDVVEIEQHDLRFQVRLVPFTREALAAELRGAGVVLALPSHALPLAELCRELQVPCVYNPEYTLRTRLQFMRAERKNPLRQLWGAWWEVRQELRFLHQVRLASGIQCNGLPAYLAYAPSSRAPLVYFDSRILRRDLATELEVAAGNSRRRRGEPLHLVFSGRLIRAKGADHLARVAQALVKQGVPFRMTICGDGNLKSSIEAQIRALQLEARVELVGVLDFATQLLPLLKQSADLFVCCHQQGDPSCTYLETFACGVPVVGYDNESLTTLVSETAAGAAVPMGHAELLADLIAGLHANREQLCTWSLRVREFAARHTMELTFEQRVKQLRSIRDQLAPTAEVTVNRGVDFWRQRVAAAMSQFQH